MPMTAGAIGSNRGRDSRNAYLPTVAGGVSWRLYELLPKGAAGGRFVEPLNVELK